MTTTRRMGHVDCPYINDVATLKADMNAVKSDIKDIKIILKELPDKLDGRYATKEELIHLKENIMDTRVGVNKITDILARWGPLLAVLAYMVLGKFLW